MLPSSTSELLRSGVQIPIIFLTGDGTRHQSRCRRVFTKPVDDDALLNAVRQCISGHPASGGSTESKGEVVNMTPYTELAVDTEIHFGEIVGTAESAPGTQRTETVAPADSTV